MTEKELIDRTEKERDEKWPLRDLTGSKLATLPPEICQLGSLESLILRDTRLNALPPEIGNLGSLAYLDLSGSKLNLLSPEIGQLINLESLYLKRTRLTTLPPEIGSLVCLKILYLSDSPLTALPPEIGKLSSLEKLGLSGTQVSVLPPEISNLGCLKTLDLRGTQLSDLPPEIGKLRCLKYLNLTNTRLITLPPEIGKLGALEILNLSNTHISALPPWIGQLGRMKTLNLSGTPLTVLPPEIGNMSSLQSLDLSHTQLSTLPPGVGQLSNLREIKLEGCPLNPILATAYNKGNIAFKAYLASLAKTVKQLYEVKLVLAGEGGVGKTTLLKALTGKSPQEDEKTTHGVNVWPFKASHPDREGIDITFNAWDFGGQDIYRITHQFFFSPQAIYLVVWKPREGEHQGRIEDWLHMIRLRTGNTARVFIVSTHCKTDRRAATISKDRLYRDYGDIIAGFHEVDSLVKDETTGDWSGVKELKRMLAREAAKLSQMGMAINEYWLRAYNEILAIDRPHIPYEQVKALFFKCGVDDVSGKIIANSMNNMGHIIYFDEEPLDRDLIRDPQWLIRAIGLVLQDKTTSEMNGILPDERLFKVWHDHPFDGVDRFDPGFYNFFLKLMEKFDVSYRFDDGTKSLVAQHVPYQTPENLPWKSGSAVENGKRRISLVCDIEDRVPDGLVPWMIVRTHRWRYPQEQNNGHLPGSHWQKGMFLSNGDHGQAYLELRDRRFEIHVQALAPEYFTGQLQETLDILIRQKWPGLEGAYRFKVPCQTLSADGPCKELFDVESLRKFLNDGDTEIRCQRCLEKQNIAGLLHGFQYKDDIIQVVREGFERVETGLEQIKAQFPYYFWQLLKALANETKNGPRWFTVEPMGGKWSNLTTEQFRLRVYCEDEEEGPHPVVDEGKGCYEFEQTKKWLVKCAPYLNFAAKILRLGCAGALPGFNLAWGDQAVKDLNLDEYLNIAKEASGQLLSEPVRLKAGPTVQSTDIETWRRGLLSEEERSGLLTLQQLLNEKDPSHSRLGLTRVPTPTGEYRWLCKKHLDKWLSKIPDDFVERFKDKPRKH